MEWDGKKYLLVTDYFMKYLFLFQISSTTVSPVINCLTEPFAIKGTPLEIFADNGQPLTLGIGVPSQINMASNIALQVHTVISPMDWFKSHLQSIKAEAYRILLPYALMKMWQTPISPNLPSPEGILNNWAAGPYVPGQHDLSPRDPIEHLGNTHQWEAA